MNTPYSLIFSNRLPDDLRKEFRKILEMASATVPIDSLFADVSGSPDKVSNAKMSDEAFIEVVVTTFKTLRAGGLKSSEIRDMLNATEPFRSSWPETTAKLDELDKGSDHDE